MGPPIYKPPPLWKYIGQDIYCNPSKVSWLLIPYLLPGVLLNVYIRWLLLIFLYLLQTCPDNHLGKWYIPDKMNHLSSTTKLQIFVTEIERLEHALGSLFLCFEIIGSRYTQFENPVIKKKLKLKKKVAQFPEAWAHNGNNILWQVDCKRKNTAWNCTTPF